MNLKAIKAISLALVGVLSVTSISPLTASAVDFNNIDTYYESKLDLLQGNKSSILDVLENKKAIFISEEAEKEAMTVTTTVPVTTTAPVTTTTKKVTTTTPVTTTAPVITTKATTKATTKTTTATTKATTKATTTTAPVTTTKVTTTTTTPVTTTTTTTTTTTIAPAQPIAIVSDSKSLYYGIDVSKWQGTINWQKVKASGIDFAIIRAGYTASDGSFCKDQYYEYNYEQCKKYGIPVGCYYYTRATSVSKAVSEANYLITLMSGKSFEYPVCFDIEDSSLPTAQRTLLTNITKAFCSTTESAGYYTSIYANPNWFDNILYSSQLTSYDKWLAHWATTPKYGNEFGGLWQKGVGTCSGITGDCDIDRSYRNYSYIISNAHLNGF